MRLVSSLFITVKYNLTLSLINSYLDEILSWKSFLVKKDLRAAQVDTTSRNFRDLKPNPGELSVTLL